MIKKWKAKIAWIWGLTLFLLFCVDSSAAEGELGFFGGISEGESLPKIMEEFVPSKKETKKVYQYKEVVFFSAKPIELTGTITVNINSAKLASSDSGSYAEEYQIVATNEAAGATLDRKVRLNTSFRKQENPYSYQVIKDSKLVGWVETLKIGDKTLTLVPEATTFSKSTAEDVTPGVNYYATDVSYVAKYIDEGKKAYYATMNGKITGFKQPWSKLESQVMELNINSPENKFHRDIQMKPKLEANRSIYYESTDPFQISFSGTYNQRLERKATLSYEIRNYEPNLKDSEKSGAVLLQPHNPIEKLLIPKKLEFLKGHWAEEDMKQLYSLGVYTEIPHSGMQFEAMSRGEYVKALCLAMNVDVSKYKNPKKNAPQIFGDIPPSHPLYPYVMAAYDIRMVDGTGADFSVDRPITRQEAFAIYIRVIGLERLGVTTSPQTPFLDDKEIAPWAKREIMAGYKIGVILGDNEGKVYPKRWFTKAEAAAVINRLINYLRTEIGSAY
ncbi:MAG: S-layer homology domain-containing protein [Eubacteriales bacterium]|nr:S-layer homology domain-containing protein [Eubacteriales bacterium]